MLASVTSAPQWCSVGICPSLALCSDHVFRKKLKLTRKVKLLVHDPVGPSYQLDCDIFCIQHWLHMLYQLYKLPDESAVSRITRSSLNPLSA